MFLPGCLGLYDHHSGERNFFIHSGFPLEISGVGITNNSGIIQNFVTPP